MFIIKYKTILQYLITAILTGAIHVVEIIVIAISYEINIQYASRLDVSSFRYAGKHINKPIAIWLA